MVNISDSTSLNLRLELYLVLLEPSKALPRSVNSVRDVYEYRSVLKKLPCSNETVAYLAQIIVDAIVSRKRFRKVECIKVLRTIIKNGDEVPNLESKTIRLLFQIYKNLVFIVSEEGQWAASVLLKGQLLEDQEIQWLIENHQQCVHPLNRLLRYPQYHPLIAAWAEEAYKAHQFPARAAELVALLIRHDIPSYVDQTDTDMVIEAVLHSRIPVADKEALLMKLTRPENLDGMVEITLRLGMSSLNHYLIREIENLQLAMQVSGDDVVS